MPLSEARKKANKAWNDAHMKERYDRIQIVVEKGQKEKIDAAAKRAGKSTSGFIKDLVAAELERIEAGGGSGVQAEKDTDI